MTVKLAAPYLVAVPVATNGAVTARDAFPTLPTVPVACSVVGVYYRTVEVTEFTRRTYSASSIRLAVTVKVASPLGCEIEPGETTMIALAGILRP